jgi:hypothetical protein
MRRVSKKIKQVMTQANSETLASFATPLPRGSVLLLDPEQLRTTAEVIPPPKAVAPPLSLRGLKLQALQSV